MICLFLLLLTCFHSQIQQSISKSNISSKKHQLHQQQPFQYSLLLNLPHHIHLYNGQIFAMNLQTISSPNNKFIITQCIPKCTFQNKLVYFDNISKEIQIKIQGIRKQLLSQNWQFKYQILSSQYNVLTQGNIQEMQIINNKQVNKIDKKLKISQTNCQLSVYLNTPDQWYYNSVQTIEFQVQAQNQQFQANIIYTLSVPYGYQRHSNTQCNIDSQIGTCSIVMKNVNGQQVITLNINLVQSGNLFSFILQNVISPSSAQSSEFQFSGCSNFVPFELTCTLPCQTCEGSSLDDCVTCYQNSYLSSGDCVTQCPIKTFANKTSSACENCGQNCNTCLSSIQCTACESPNVLYNLSCLQQCPIGTYQTNNSCLTCFGNCATCPNNPSQCESCMVGFYNSSTLCFQCPLTCVQCTQYAICIICLNSPGITLNNFQCTSQCSLGQYLKDSNCQKCSSNCLYCSNTSNCLVCKNSTFLSEGVCYQCQKGCRSCISSNICVQCNEGVIFSNYSCLGCKPGYLQYNNECIVGPKTNDIIPLPFTIISMFVLALCCASQLFYSNKTFFSLMYFSLNSIIETCALLTLLSLVVQNKIYQFASYSIIIGCLATALTIGFVMSIVHLFLLKNLRDDTRFQKWWQDYCCTNFIIHAISILNLRVFYIIFSRAFGNRTFNASIQNISNFNRSWWILIASCFPSVLLITGAAIQLSNSLITNLKYSVYSISIDCMIVSILGSIFLTIFILKYKNIQQQLVTTESKKMLSTLQSNRIQLTNIPLKKTRANSS